MSGSRHEPYRDERQKNAAGVGFALQAQGKCRAAWQRVVWQSGGADQKQDMKLTSKTQNPVASNTGGKVPMIAGSGLSWPTALPPSDKMRRLLILIVALLPSIWAIGYYGIFASDRFVSEATFVVRSSNRASAGGFAALLRMVGVSSSQDDTFAVHDFIASRDAISQLQGKINLDEVYGRDGVDSLSRYPNLFYGRSLDEFQRYLKSRILVTFNSNTGISTLQVQAFTPAEAQAIARLLLEFSEQVINRMNTRIHDDAVRFAQEEVKMVEDRLRKIQLAITDFCNREIQIDPNRSSVLVMELVAKLSDEVSRLTAQIAEVTASSPNSPQLLSMERRVEALRYQIGQERARITDSSDGLAQKIARFEELNLEREFAARALASAILSLDNARAEARRQQLYLERISGPGLPDRALMPQRLFEIISLIVANLVILLVGWLVMTGITEHAPKLDRDRQ
jgi:capsular polysaccharide transport system permease protein